MLQHVKNDPKNTLWKEYASLFDEVFKQTHYIAAVTANGDKWDGADLINQLFSDFGYAKTDDDDGSATDPDNPVFRLKIAKVRMEFDRTAQMVKFGIILPGHSIKEVIAALEHGGKGDGSNKDALQQMLNADGLDVSSQNNIDAFKHLQAYPGVLFWSADPANVKWWFNRDSLKDCAIKTADDLTKCLDGKLGADDGGDYLFELPERPHARIMTDTAWGKSSSASAAWEKHFGAVGKHHSSKVGASDACRQASFFKGRRVGRVGEAFQQCRQASFFKKGKLDEGRRG